LSKESPQRGGLSYYIRVLLKHKAMYLLNELAYCILLECNVDHYAGFDSWMNNKFFEALVTAVFTALVFWLFGLVRFYFIYRSWEGHYREQQFIQGEWKDSGFAIQLKIEVLKKQIKVSFHASEEKETFVVFDVDRSFPSRLEAPFFQAKVTSQSPNWGIYSIEKNSSKDSDAFIIGHKSNVLDEKRYATPSRYATISGKAFVPQPMNYKRIIWKRVTSPLSSERYSG